MMPLFVANFGSTLDSLGEPPEPGEEEDSAVESVKSFCIIFVVIGVVSALAGFTMVTLWSISGERQVLTVPLLLFLLFLLWVVVVVVLVARCCCCACRELLVWSLLIVKKGGRVC